MPPKRDWTELTWEDFARGDPTRWIAVLPTAAVEQHGPHLPLGTDTFIAESYLTRVRKALPTELPAIFLPVQAIGTSEEHRAFPGTLSLSVETLLRLLIEMGTSVHRAGVCKLVIVNSHGGNAEVIRLAARDLRARLRMLVVTASWHQLGYPDGVFTDDERIHGIHAGDIETSLMLAGRSDTVSTERLGIFPSAARDMEREFKWLRLDEPAGFGWMTQDLNPDGAIGNAQAATAAKGQAAFDHGTQAFVSLLAEVDRFDLARLAEAPRG
jgi:creatinine amidohydrolase